jgi:Acetyltransferase (GNAT) family.
MKITDLDKIKELTKPFIMHYNDSEWGEEILIMQEHGLAFARIYWYNDDDTSVYLDWLSVSEDSRKQGIGTKLITLLEEIGRLLGASFSYLYVRKMSWMYDWYKRNSYIDYKENKDNTNMIWMVKSLIKDKDGK